MIQVLLLVAGLIYRIYGIDVCPPAPPFEQSCFARLMLPGCSSDNDCTKLGTKCCKTECNVLQCVESKQGIVKGAICPPLPNVGPYFCLTAKISSDCTGSDANCPGEKKCCPTVCGSKICRDPITEPRKACPAFVPPIRCISYEQHCSSDLECSNGDICCHVPCGIGCRTPYKPQNQAPCPIPKCAVPTPSSCTKPDFKIFNGVKCPWCLKIVPCKLNSGLYSVTVPEVKISPQTK